MENNLLKTVQKNYNLVSPRNTANQLEMMQINELYQ